MAKKSSRRDRELLLDESARPMERAGAISAIGADRLVEYEGVIAGLLRHADPAIRERAASVLVSVWGLRKYVDDVVQMLRNDIDWNCRWAAAAALGSYAKASSIDADRLLILRELARSTAYDDDSSVQKASYESFLELAAPTRAGEWRDDFNVIEHADWSLLDPYLEPT